MGDQPYRLQVQDGTGEFDIAHRIAEDREEDRVKPNFAGMRATPMIQWEVFELGGALLEHSGSTPSSAKALACSGVGRVVTLILACGLIAVEVTLRVTVARSSSNVRKLCTR